MSDNTALANKPADSLERVIALGDLSKLTPDERTRYYASVCESIGLNPLTRPFEYLTLNGKLTLYARKDCTDQLRSLRRVSLAIADRQQLGDVYVVTARATMTDGRVDESIGAVTITNLKGDALANALMKCETKAKRRVTLSICGLGLLDETEIETIPANAAPQPFVDAEQQQAALPPTPISAAAEKPLPPITRTEKPARDEMIQRLKSRAYTAGIKTVKAWQDWLTEGLGLSEWHEHALDDADSKALALLFEKLDELENRNY